MEKHYVFVVCGEASHIETLHFSLKMLKTFTSYPIIVVTDSSRNEIPVQHDQILDLTTPENFTNHQAAIYLKTKLHQILPAGCLYCYLDTDVIAIKSGVDIIFDHYIPPITFCTDHCNLEAFSPNAVYDVFYDDLLKKQQHLSDLYYKFQQEEAQQQKSAGPNLIKIQSLKVFFNQHRPAHTQPLRGKNFYKILISKMIYWLLFGIAYLAAFFNQKYQKEQYLEKLHQLVFNKPLNFNLFLAFHGLKFNLTEEKWYDLEGNLLYEENLIVKRIEANTLFRWDKEAQVWRDEAGENISYIKSDKLIHLIDKKFNIHITNPQWRHWNGGVFLFDITSHHFMEQWHQWTLEIFKDATWKVRDQGTLIATVWKFGLQQHPTLPIIFNLIADFYHPALAYKGDFVFYLDDCETTIHPYFLHIYHHWGDRSWQLWRDVEKHFLDLQ